MSLRSRTSLTVALLAIFGTAPLTSEAGLKKILEEPVEAIEEAVERSEPGSSTTLSTRYLGLAPSWMSHLGASGLAYELSGGFGWDTSTMMIQLGASVQLHREAIAARSGVLLKYFIPHRWRGDFAPYIEGGFGLGVATRIQEEAGSPEQTAAGFSVSGGVGLQLLRTADVHLDLGLRAHMLLDANESGRPGGMSLGLQLFF